MAAPAYGHHRLSHSPHPRGPALVHAAPAGTFPPGTAITVGSHKCTIDRYLSEGGFAHVYLVRLTKPVNGTDVAVLKRVAVPDKEALGNMRTEVDTMKRLKGHRHIVTYIDSHASHLKGGNGYEVFLLMEYCSGGGLIDFMNTRLQHRLTEPEVLKIFSDVAEGVACMHYLRPPLLHRDLKVENVLIAPGGQYKLCDFGSCSPVKPAPQSVVECRLLEEDIQKHTTLQYRSPEMVDVFRRLPVDEKSDIWALGVLLYKLCYYTTPFEEHGTLAILNATFSYPAYPVFSDRLKALIALMLREKPHERPNIYQVVREACYMRGKQVPIPDIYSGAVKSPPAEKPSSTSSVQSPPPSVVQFQSPPAIEQPVIPDVVPMRRGRPTANTAAAPPSKPHSSATSQTRANGKSPNVGPVSADPFAALDAKAPSHPDEISNRFPSVEQFSLLHDSGSKFQFTDSARASPAPSEAQQQRFNERVAEKLAEQAFGTSPPKPEMRATIDATDLGMLAHGPSGSYETKRDLYEPQPKRPVMVSTGTMTSPSPSSSPKILPYDSPSRSRELTAAPSSATTTTSQRPSEAFVAAKLKEYQESNRPSLIDIGRSSTAVPTMRVASSSRPSLESHRSISTTDVATDPISRSKSANSRSRPHSVYVESNLEFLRDLESPSSAAPSTADGLGRLGAQHSGASLSSQQSEHIESNVEFLRAMENEANESDRRRSISGGAAYVSRHVKRASMPSISLPKPGPVKNKLGGKFSAAFHRFERGHGGGGGGDSEPSSPSEPSFNSHLGPEFPDPNPSSDAGDEWEVSSQEISPEVRRELEKRQLQAEERRVAAAAAEYKARVAGRGDPNTTTKSHHLSIGSIPQSSRDRASSIQARVQSLLNESATKEPPRKTAEGYGRYTAEPTQISPTESRELPGSKTPRHDTYRMQAAGPAARGGGYNHTGTTTSSSSRPTTSSGSAAAQTLSPTQHFSVPSRADPIQRPVTAAGHTIISSTAKIVRKPVASPSAPPPPPKPTNLRTGNSTVIVGGAPPQQGQSQVSSSGGGGGVHRRRGTEDLIDLAGDGLAVPGSQPAQGQSAEEWERNFAKRYPSLSGLEMVETVIATGKRH